VIYAQTQAVPGAVVSRMSQKEAQITLLLVEYTYSTMSGSARPAFRYRGVDTLTGMRL
jgi:hypothetical protein